MREHRIGRLNGRYVVSWWEAGKRRRYRLDSASLPDAKREALDVIQRETTAPGAPTIHDLWEAYRAEKAGRRVVTAMGFEWRYMRAEFGHLRPEQLTTEHCRAFVAKRRADGKKDGTIWTELGHLRTVFRWAADRRLIAYAPKVERPAKPAPKDRYLTRAECERLVAAAPAAHIRLAIILMLSTAARVGAVLDLTWDRVDFERGVIRLRLDDAVTRKGRATVPMNAGLKAALSAAKMTGLSDSVIEWAGRPVGSIKTGFNRAVKDAGLESVSPHVLRHTAAVHMAEAGITMAEISQYLGHEDERITARVYARFSPGHLQKAADVLDFTAVRRAT